MVKVTYGHLNVITTGNATRLCMSDGNWADPDVLECESEQFLQLLSQVYQQVRFSDWYT